MTSCAISGRPSQWARLDAAEDRARLAEAAAIRAESERALLAAAEQRAADSCATAQAEKAKLEASRDAAFAMKAAREAGAYSRPLFSSA